jgi:MFS family permease
MPAIIRGMGYSNVNAQLLTVPVYFVGAISFIIIARLSDRYQMRSPFIVGCFISHIVGEINCITDFVTNANGILGYGILVGVQSSGARYVGVFICAIGKSMWTSTEPSLTPGLYGIPGLNVAWISNNTAGHYKRTTAFGVNQLMGNSAGAA